MLRIIFAAALFLSTAICHAVEFGRDDLGGPKYKSVLVQNLNKARGEGHFINTFGDALPLVKEEARFGVPFIRLHLMWKDNHRFSRSDFPAIEKEARRVCPTIRANPQVKWYLSGACEHNLNESDARALARLVTAACDAAEYVNTPMVRAGATLSEYLNEFHGKDNRRTRRFAYSWDGDSAEDSNVQRILNENSEAVYIMVWGPRCNGRWESNDPTPRPQRKGYPDAKYLRSLAYLFSGKGATSPPPKSLWKSHSENKGNGDPRAEKPVFITPMVKQYISVRRAGKEISRLSHYGKYTDGRERYYGKIWGYEMGVVELWTLDRVRKPNGKAVMEWVYKGTVNAGFRDGDSYR